MRMLSLLSAASFLGMWVTFGIGHLAGANAETAPDTAKAPPASRVSGPHVHDNLAVYFVHGPSAPGAVPLTLAEAMAAGSVKVLETGTVNALVIENSGDEEVYIQAGDIVKGGKQDRVLTVTLLLPPKSGRVPIASFCVEQGRWAARGKEDLMAFASATETMPSREAKLAMRRPATKAAAGDGPSARTAAIPSYTEPNTGGIVQQRRTTGGGESQDTGSRQTEVWNEVAKTQRKLAAGLDAASVAAPESASSLQLSLENQKLKDARAGYVKALQDKARDQGDVVGLVFAVNGKVNSADIYPSHGLFQKMWPKLLNASVTEAIGEKTQQGADAAAPGPMLVEEFLSSAEKGKADEQSIGKLMQQETRDAEKSLYVEARKLSGGFVHRNYLAK